MLNVINNLKNNYNIMNTTSEKLEHILTIDELSRENDKRLISEYLKEFH
jgi:hypothetical protein